MVRCIWDQRNQVIFRQGVVDVKEIFQMTQLKSWLWLKHRARSFDYSFFDWHLNPILCLKSYVWGVGIPIVFLVGVLTVKFSPLFVCCSRCNDLYQQGASCTLSCLWLLAKACSWDWYQVWQCYQRGSLQGSAGACLWVECKPLFVGWCCEPKPTNIKVSTTTLLLWVLLLSIWGFL